jgi:LemA protein
MATSWANDRTFEDDELSNRSYFKCVTLGPGSSTGVMNTSKPDTCGSGIEGAQSEVAEIHHRSSKGSKGVESIMVALIVVVVVVVLLAVALWAAFNGLIKKRNRTQEAWSEIDVELKRRHDLIPNLVTTVKGYAAHEQGTFEAVTQARANAVSAGATGDPRRSPPRRTLCPGRLRSLFAVAENYPQLRAVESFLQLQETLTSTEDKIEYARRYYNTSARDYNIAADVSAQPDRRARSASRPWRSSPPTTRTAPCLRSISRASVSEGHRSAHGRSREPPSGQLSAAEPARTPPMYSEIASNKRRSVAFIGLFFVIWLAIGGVLGLLFRAPLPPGRSPPATASTRRRSTRAGGPSSSA